MKPVSSVTKISLLMAALLSSGLAHGAEGDGRRADLENAAQGSLPVAQAAPRAARARDRRVLISQLKPGPGVSEAAVAAARHAAQTTFEVRNARFNGEPLNTMLGTGFLIDNKYCPGRYALSVAHVVAKTAMVKDEKTGQVREEILYKTSRKGTTIETRHGLDGSGKVVKNSGVVVSTGSLDGDTPSDWVLIRLDKKVAAMPFPAATGEDEEFINIPLMALGLPLDLSGMGDDRVIAVDLACRGANRRGISGGVASSCIGAPGQSGGPVLANIATEGQSEEWRIVGVTVKSSKINFLDTLSSMNLPRGEVEFLSLLSIGDIINLQMKYDAMASPCE